MTKTSELSTCLGAVLLGLVLAGCGGGSDPDEVEPLAAPVEGTWGDQSVTLVYGFATTTEGLQSIWSSGVDPDGAPLAVVLSTAEVSCDTDLGAGRPPQGYSIILLFPSEEVGAESSEQQKHSFVDGWINSGGSGGTVAGMLSAVDDETLGGSIDLQDDGLSFSGQFTVPRC